MIKEYQVASGVMAFSTTRKGGVSQGNYGEFNINEFCGDFAEHVAENRKRLAAELGITTDHIIMPHQVHGVEVRNIAGEFLTMPENIRKMVLEGVDAVMTDQKGVCIGVSTADCIPVLLYDEEHHAAAAIHAGWRGTLARIVHKTIQEMAFTYHTDPKKLKAVIGPGIRSTISRWAMRFTRRSSRQLSLWKRLPNSVLMPPSRLILLSVSAWQLRVISCSR